MSRRFQVSRRVEWRVPPHLVRVRTVDAPDEATALRQVASSSGLPLNILVAREVPPLAPVGNRPLNGDK